MVIWLYGYMVIWLYGYMVIWLYGYMVIWLNGYMVIWLLVIGYMVITDLQHNLCSLVIT